MDSDDLYRLSREVIGAAIEVHRVLGPALLESAYFVSTCAHGTDAHVFEDDWM